MIEWQFLFALWLVAMAFQMSPSCGCCGITGCSDCCDNSSVPDQVTVDIPTGWADDDCSGCDTALDNAFVLDYVGVAESNCTFETGSTACAAWEYYDSSFCSGTECDYEISICCWMSYLNPNCRFSINITIDEEPAEFACGKENWFYFENSITPTINCNSLNRTVPFSSRNNGGLGATVWACDAATYPANVTLTS